MTAALPHVGGDQGLWGAELNNWLLVAHNADGTANGNAGGISGAQGNGRVISDAAITSGSFTLSSLSASFTSADVGKLVLVIGAGTGGLNLNTTISACTSTSTVTLAASASTTVTGAQATYGTDDKLAIQLALDSGGAINAPAATYCFSGQLSIYADTSLSGDGPGLTIFQAFGQTGQAIYGTDLNNVTLQGFTLFGPGENQGEGCMWLNRIYNPDQQQLKFSSLLIEYFAGDGITLSNPVNTSFDHVRVLECAGNGINCYGISGGAGGTSVTFGAGCYMGGNALAGYYLQQMSYCNFIGTAADSNYIGYLLQSCTGITINGCGAESTQIRASTIYDGSGIRIQSDPSSGQICEGITINGFFTYASAAKSINVVGAQKGISISNCYEGGPGGGATFIYTDPLAEVTLDNNVGTSASSLGALTTVLNDGSGNTVIAGNLTVKGTVNNAGSIPWLLSNVGSVSYQSCTYNSYGQITSSGITWPDGTTGAYAATTSLIGGLDVVTGQTWTWAGSTTHTVTQPTMTYNASAQLTYQPALTAV